MSGRRILITGVAGMIGSHLLDALLARGDTVTGITDSLVQATDLRGHTLGDRQTGRIVLGAVDTQAGGKPLHSGLQGTLGFVQVALCGEGCNVGIDDLCHFLTPYPAGGAIPGSPRVRLITGGYAHDIVHLPPPTSVTAETMHPLAK